jgi:hypothetical protein
LQQFSCSYLVAGYLAIYFFSPHPRVSWYPIFNVPRMPFFINARTLRHPQLSDIRNPGTLWIMYVPCGRSIDTLTGQWRMRSNSWWRSQNMSKSLSPIVHTGPTAQAGVYMSQHRSRVLPCLPESHAHFFLWILAWERTLTLVLVRESWGADKLKDKLVRIAIDAQCEKPQKCQMNAWWIYTTVRR